MGLRLHRFEQAVGRKVVKEAKAVLKIGIFFSLVVKAHVDGHLKAVLRCGLSLGSRHGLHSVLYDFTFVYKVSSRIGKRQAGLV